MIPINLFFDTNNDTNDTNLDTNLLDSEPSNEHNYNWLFI